MTTDFAAAESLRVQAWAAARSGNREYAAKLFRQILEEHPGTAASDDARLFFTDNPHPTVQDSAPTLQRVTVVDLDISFLNMVGLFIKAAIAIIPAAIIVAVLYYVALGVLAGVFSRY